MKARQAKKIFNYSKGGRTHKVSPYWYTRLVDFRSRKKTDHRIVEVNRILSRADRKELNRRRRIAPDTMSAMEFLVNEMLKGWLKGRKEATE